jgi:hypothetical protein
VAILGHDPFEAPLSCDFEERDPVGFDVFAQAHPRVWAEDASEESPAFLERYPHAGFKPIWMKPRAGYTQWERRPSSSPA